MNNSKQIASNGNRRSIKVSKQNRLRLFGPHLETRLVCGVPVDELFNTAAWILELRCPYSNNSERQLWTILEWIAFHLFLHYVRNLLLQQPRNVFILDGTITSLGLQRQIVDINKYGYVSSVGLCLVAQSEEVRWLPGAEYQVSVRIYRRGQPSLPFLFGQYIGIRHVREV